MEETLRMIERILATSLGGFFAWLGYRLFLDVSIKQNSAGQFKLPTGIAIHLTRIGPGIFFALFGAAAVCYSFYSQVTIHRTQSQTDIPDAAKALDGRSNSRRITSSTDITAITGHQGTVDEQTRLKRNEYRNYLKYLDELGTYLDAKPGSVAPEGSQIVIPRIKFAVLQAVWRDDWGSEEVFEDWLNHGAKDGDVPASATKEPYDYFQAK